MLKRAQQTPLLLVLVLVLAAVAIGCRSTNTGNGDRTGGFLFNTSTNSIEAKAAIISQLAVARVLQNHPNAKPKLQIAADDLLIIEKSDLLTVEPILEIINRLPPDTFKDPNTGLYIQAGVLFFADELGTVAAQNPAQLRAAARGLRRGIEAVIATK